MKAMQRTGAAQQQRMSRNASLRLTGHLHCLSDTSDCTLMYFNRALTKKKERLSIDEKGHVKPANFMDTEDKILIGIVAKGGGQSLQLYFTSIRRKLVRKG